MAVLLLSAVAALVLAGARQAAASFGDRDPNFVSCVNHYGAAFKGPLPTHLRLLGWSPDAETRYHCMHLVTKWRKQNNLPMLQYYGKWPFTRVYGIQEPASLVASLGNGYFVLRGLFLYRRKVPQRYPLRPMWLAIAVIGVMSWVASSVFHARDVEWTERMDYFCAQLYMASQVVGAVGRGFGPRAARWAVPPVLAAFVFHVAYLTILLPRFDYGWNMVVMISVGVCNCLSWLLWCWKNRASNPWTSYCAAIVVALLLTAGLEVLEFEPWWLAVDSHALWHFSTIPMSYAWYEFVRRDSLHHHAQLQMTGHRAE